MGWIAAGGKAGQRAAHLSGVDGQQDEGQGKEGKEQALGAPPAPRGGRLSIRIPSLLPALRGRTGGGALGAYAACITPSAAGWLLHRRGCGRAGDRDAAGGSGGGLPPSSVGPLPFWPVPSPAPAACPGSRAPESACAGGGGSGHSRWKSQHSPRPSASHACMHWGPRVLEALKQCLGSRRAGKLDNQAPGVGHGQASKAT